MSKRVTCVNEDNIEVTFSYEEDETFFLESLDGVYAFENNVVTSENTVLDGSTYIGSKTKARNIVINAHMDGNYQENRDILYKCFKPKSTGIFTHYENQKTRKIEYKVESLEIEEKGTIRGITISLICPTPYFEAMIEKSVDMAAFSGGWTFPKQFNGKESMKILEAEILKTIDNEAAADNVGMEITIEARGTVINPVIWHVEDNEFIKINTEIYAGQKIRITTGLNNKKVHLIKSDGTEEDINMLIDEESDFIQLSSGKNTLKYDADGGSSYMLVTVKYKELFLGV